MEGQESLFQEELSVFHCGVTFAAVRIIGCPMVLQTEEGRPLAMIHLVNSATSKMLNLLDSADTVATNTVPQKPVPRGEVFCGIVREDNFRACLVITNLFYEGVIFVQLFGMDGTPVFERPIASNRSRRSETMTIDSQQMAIFQIRVIPPPAYDWTKATWRTQVEFMVQTSDPYPKNLIDDEDDEVVEMEQRATRMVALWVTYDDKVPLPQHKKQNKINDAPKAFAMINAASRARNERMLKRVDAVIRSDCIVCEKPDTELVFVPCGHCYMHYECFVIALKPKQCDLCSVERKGLAFI